MLHDPRRDQKTKAETYKLTGLIAYLETQDPAERYSYNAPRGTCLIARYLTAVGEDGALGYGKFESTGIRQVVAQRSPQTYGAALERARTIQFWRK